jgi:hypothetical protein
VRCNGAGRARGALPFRRGYGSPVWARPCRAAVLAGKIGTVTDFGGLREFTTWDGEPISREQPHGATIVVASRSPLGWRYLLLHRAHHGPDYDGDWAWTPPSGSRKPGEEVTACAIRELREETGLRERPWAVMASDVDWAIFALEIPWGTPITLMGPSMIASNGSPLPMLTCAASQQC